MAHSANLPNDLNLSIRSGLPEALAVLLAQYPRDGWTSDPGFDALIRFWLDRHVMFRRVIQEMQKSTQMVLDHQIDAGRYVSALSRYGAMFVNGLHEHHTIEDTHYFPKLMTHDSRLARGFDILERDHHTLDHHLSEFVSGTNQTLGHQGDRDALQDNAGRILASLNLLDRLLDRHLLDEEDLIVPVLLKFGAP